jgi:hypothetical protein
VDTGGFGARRQHPRGEPAPPRGCAKAPKTEDLKEKLPRLELLWADGAYTGGFRQWAEEEL